MISAKSRKKIEEIKQLKENNFQKKYQTYMTFYKEFGRPKSKKNPIKLTLHKNPKNNDNFFYFRLRNKNSLIYKNDNRNNYLNTFNPYVTMMLAKGTNLTNYDHTEYVMNHQHSLPTQSDFSTRPTQYNIPKKKTFFGLDPKTPLYDNDPIELNTDNFKMSYLNDLNDLCMKTSMGMKTMTYFPKNENQFNSKYNYNFKRDKHFTFEDEEFANNIYFDGNVKKEERRFQKGERNRFYEDFDINKKLTYEEKNEIIKKIKNNKDIQKKIIETRDYKDPFKSKKLLKINSQMNEAVEKIRLDLQCQKFQEEYDSICKYNIRKNRMPNIKVMSKKTTKNNNDANLSFKKIKSRKKNFGQKEEIYSNLKEYLTHKMQEQFIHSENKISRYDHHLSEIKIDLGIIPISHHPELRTFSSICYDELNNIIYLYGGIGGKKFGDLWGCKYDPNIGKIIWNKIYSPLIENEEDHQYMEIKEPLPRYGQTIHLIKNRLFLIGGEFDNWDKNIYKNEFLWIYDLGKNSWDLEENFKTNINTNNIIKTNSNKSRIKKGLSAIANNFLKNIPKNNYKSNQTISSNLNKLKSNEKSKSYKNMPKFKNDNIWIKSSNNNSIKKKIIDKEERKVLFSNKLVNKLSKKISKKAIPTILKKSEINYIFNDNKNMDESNNSENIEEKVMVPCLRRNHISIVIGSTIFVYGGININKNFLNDCWIYDLNTGKWDLIEYKGRYPPPLGFHSCCIALEKEQLSSDSLSIYNKPSSNLKTLPLLKLDGVFFFGGINETKMPTNLFFHMTIGVRPVIFDIPPINGKPPSPRINASMNFSPYCNMIIIYGGKNELKQESFINDIILLDLETLDWIHPVYNNFIPPERAEHLSTIIGNQLIVFGGTSAEALLNFDFILFNIDF